MLRPHSDSMTITTNSGVLVATVFARSLSLKHLTVLGNTVALTLRDAVLTIQRLALRWCPGKIVAADLDIVVRELAELVVVHTEQLSLL